MTDWLPFAAGALVLAAIWGHGYSTGQAVRDGENAAALTQAREEAAAIRHEVDAAEAARLKLERERDALQAQLDEESRSDPDADRRALSADSMSRVRQSGY